VVPSPGNPQDLNRYAYTRNNPLRYTDPSGHIPCLDKECNWTVHPVTGRAQWHGRPLGAWREEAVENLMNAGPTCQHAAQFIVDNDITIGFTFQLFSAARWTLSGGIELDPMDHGRHLGQGIYSIPDPSDPGVLGAIVHEAKHLEQGMDLALSVEGEVGGWTVHFEAMQELGNPIPDPRRHWRNVANTPTSPTDQDLRDARREMLAYTGYDYLVWLLPLRPDFWTNLVRGYTRPQFVP